MIEGTEKLRGCSQEIIDIVNFLQGHAESKHTDLVITSGKRDGDPSKSHHNAGNAIDFHYRNIHAFKLVSELFNFYLYDPSFRKATEFEVVCSQDKHHIHIAFGKEPKKEYFTGVY